jgi:hypothetical protein
LQLLGLLLLLLLFMTVFLSQWQRAMAQLRPDSVPAVIKDMAGKNHAQTLRDFDRHYMPNRDGHPDPDVSATGFDSAHRSELKRKADGISRSLSEVFAFLTHSGLWRRRQAGQI